jgi:signal transduction histidine kinase
MLQYGGSRGTRARAEGDGTAGPYRGPDRRTTQLAASLDRTSTPPHRTVLWLMVGSATLIAAATSVPPPFEPLVLPSLRIVVVALTALLAVLLGQVWRATGAAGAAWTHAGVAVLVIPAVFDVATPLWAFDAAAMIRTAAVLAAGWSIAVAASGPAVDSALRPTRAILGSYALLLGTGLVLLAAGPGLLPAEVLALVAVLPALAWVVLLVRLIPHRRSSDSPVPSWLLTAFATVALVELVRLLPSSPDAWLTITAAALHATALTIAIGNAGRLLVAAAATARDAGYLDAAAATSRIRAAEEAERARRHDVRNALAAVEGAAIVLDRAGSDLNVATRDQLHRAVRTELTRLRRLVSPEGQATYRPDAACPPMVDLDLLIRDHAVLTRSAGHHVSVRGRAGVVTADPVATSRIIRNLLSNAARHGADPSGRVKVELHLTVDDTTATVTVRDHGPGIAEADRGRVFAHGWSGRPGGQGLGLHLALRLAREQGGDLRLRPPDGTGAAFDLRLRRGVRIAETMPDHQQHAGEVLEIGSLAVGLDEDPAAAGALGGVEEDRCGCCGPRRLVRDQGQGEPLARRSVHEDDVGFALEQMQERRSQ